MTTGTMPSAPLSWEYTTQTQSENSESLRLCEFHLSAGSECTELWAAYLRGIRSLIVLAFFLVFLGVVYQVKSFRPVSRAYR